MPQSLGINDYQFYLIPSGDGKYRSPKGTRGNIFRKPREEFREMFRLLSADEQIGVELLHGITEVTNVYTKRVLFVAEIFSDLKDQV